jgi:hypothetical protein
VLGDHSDAEISIETLAETVENVVELEAEPPALPPAEPAEPETDDHVEMIVGKDEDPARVVEVIKDTSSQTITMTADEPDEPAEAEPPK